VRAWTETDRARRTHSLETAEGGTCEDTERYRPTELHSHSEAGSRRYLSAHGKKPTGRGALTNWIQQRERFIRTQKGGNRPSDGHWHSHTGKRKAKVKSVYRNNVRE
jgi:hypothetical protein